jgi:hypothetical protein
MSEYIPFGDEWKAEVMRMKKSDIVAMLAKALAERAAVGRLEGERQALKLVAECFISILGNVNAAETLMPLIVKNLNKCGYGNLADDLALTGFAAALAADGAHLVYPIDGCNCMLCDAARHTPDEIGERDAPREKEYQLREAIGWAYAGINNAERLLSLGGDPVPHLQAAKAHLAAALAADERGTAGNVTTCPHGEPIGAHCHFCGDL